MTKPKIIAIHGLKGHGKSTSTAHLVKAHKLPVVKFAGPIKAMIASLLVYMGESEDTAAWSVEDAKMKITPIAELYGLTTTQLQQSLGTEWGRDHVNQNLWVDLAMLRIQKLHREDPKRIILIDDLRFGSEYEALANRSKFDTFFVKIVAPWGPTQINHRSEIGLADGLFDQIVVNERDEVDKTLGHMNMIYAHVLSS